MKNIFLLAGDSSSPSFFLLFPTAQKCMQEKRKVCVKGSPKGTHHPACILEWESPPATIEKGPLVQYKVSSCGNNEMPKVQSSLATSFLGLPKRQNCTASSFSRKYKPFKTYQYETKVSQHNYRGSGNL